MKFMSSFCFFATTTLLCLPSFADVTILDYGSDNDVAHLAYTEVIEAGDVTPTAVVGTRPDVLNPFDIGPIALTDGATISWTNATSWNNNSAAGSAGENYFAHQASQTTNPTTYSITTANPNDIVTVEAIAGFSRDGLIGYNGSSVDVNIYEVGVTGWTLIGTSVGSASGTLEISDSGDEGNIGAHRITITPATIPEPSSLVLLGLGACTAGLRRRRS